MDHINEGTTAYVTVTFRDKNGTPQAPSSAAWLVIDRATGQTMKAEAAISPAEAVELTIPASVNELVNQRKRFEVRRVIVRAQYGADDAINAQFDYQVLNISQVPAEA